jgi:uncharacterized protein
VISLKKLTNQASHRFAGLPEWIVRWKWSMWLFFVITTAVMVFGATKMRSDLTVESWFEKNDPEFLAYDNFHAQFGSEDGVLIVYKPKDGDAFSAKSLEAVRRIREELYYHRSTMQPGGRSALDHIVRVNSLINVPVLTVEKDLLVSRPLVGDTVPTAPAALEQIRKTAMAQDDITLRLVSRDHTYGAIIVDTDFGAVPCDYDQEAAKAAQSGSLAMGALTFDDNGGSDKHCFKPTDLRDYEALNAAIKAVIEKPEYAGQLQYFMAGNTAESEYQKLQQQEMAALYGVAIIIMVALLWLLFRSLSAVAWAFTIVILTSIWTMGISGFLGLTITPFIILTAFLLLTVGMADTVHLLSSYMFLRKNGFDHKAALREAYEKAGVACLLTCVTNVIGIASLCFSNIVPVGQLGVMGAIGITSALFVTLLLLPLLLDLWTPVPRESAQTLRRALPALVGKVVPNIRNALQNALERIVPAVERRPIAYCIPFLVLLAVCLYGAFHVRVDSDMLAMYQSDSKFPQSIKIIDKEMAGSSQMSVYMDFGAPQAAEDPFVLKTVDELQKSFEKKYSKYVVTTRSIVDIVKDTYQKLNQGAPDKHVVPANQNELSQTLYMFNNADPEQRKRLVDDAYKKATVTMTLRNASSYEYGDVFNSMQKDIKDALATVKTKYPQAQVSITGMFVLKMRLEQLLTETGLQSFSVSFVVINMLFFLIFFGSLKAGIIGIIPNVIPSIFVMGAMGLLGIPLDFFAIVLAPIIIGISVDDTIHFLAHYQMQYETDRDIKLALRNTMKEAGQGTVFTTLVLALGFGILAISFTPGVAKVGMFVPLAMFVGLANDLFLLPALITLFKLKGGTSKAPAPAQAAVDIPPMEKA